MVTSKHVDALANEIARRFKIGKPHKAALAKFVRESAGRSHPLLRIKSAARQQIDLRNGLEAVAEGQQRLSETVGRLSLLARDRLWHPFWEDPYRPPNHIGFGALPVTSDFPDETAFREALDALGKRTAARLPELRAVRDKGGQPENTGLRIWVARARDFWEQELERKFTYQYVKRVHKGQAFVFCSFVLKRIAPDVTKAELATAIRAMIKPMKVTVRGGPAPESIVITVRART